MEIFNVPDTRLGCFFVNREGTDNKLWLTSINSGWYNSIYEILEMHTKFPIALHETKVKERVLLDVNYL